MAESQAIEGGFADPVFNAQRVFRAAMDALAQPGTVQAVSAGAKPPAPLTAELAALALTLCDHDSTVWLDETLAAVPAVARWLRFQTGAPIVATPGDATFALIGDPLSMPALDVFAQGTQEYPDRSTTLLVAVDSLTDGPGLVLIGPGIRDTASIAPLPLEGDFVVQWRENRERFPRGVDVIFAAQGEIAGLPRSTRILEG